MPQASPIGAAVGGRERRLGESRPLCERGAEILDLHEVRLILKNMGLYRRKNESIPLEAAAFLTDRLEAPQRLRGYGLHRLTVYSNGSFTLLQYKLSCCNFISFTV